MTTLTVSPKFPLVSEEPLGFEAWKQKGETLGRVNEKNESALETSQWDIGDWLVEGEKFGPKAYAAAEKITGWPRPYLYTVVWVVKRFPISLRKETPLTWSHFKELARIEDEKTREQVLTQVNDGFTHSVRELREIVDRNWRSRPTSGERAKKPFVYLRVSFRLDFRQQVKQLARARHKRPDELLREIVESYFKKNEKEIAAELKRDKERRCSKKVSRR